MTYGAKAVFLLVLIGIYQGIYFFFTKADKELRQNTLLYLLLNLVLLVLTWPGIWRMDEFGILNSAVKLLPVFWQNYLTSLFYVFSLMLIPVPSGVIIVQCVLVSLMAGYVIRAFVRRFGKIGRAAWIPCLFFPVLDSTLYPMRMSIYGFLELFLLVVLWEKYQEAKTEDKEKQEGRHTGISWIFICILAALVTVWRTEAVYYFVLFPLLIGIIWHKYYGKKQMLRIICGYLLCALCLFVPQSVGDKLTSGNQYDLTSVVLPLVPLVDEAYGRADCKEQLDAIDRVISVELAVEGAGEGRNGISLFWSEPEFQREYTDAQYQAFKKAYYQLIVKFPATFLEERWDCFVHSVDLLQNTTELFCAEGVANYDTFRNYTGTNPISEKIRNDVIKILEWRQLKDYTMKKAGYQVVYSAILPMCILIAVWVFCLIRRKWQAFFLLALPLVRVPLIFLMAPSRLFMYYYSIYLIGYFVLVYVLLQLLASIWKRIAAPLKKTWFYARRNGVRAAYDAVMERIDRKHWDEMTVRAAAYEGCREWSVRLTPEEMIREREKQEQTHFIKEPLISIVVPAYETDARFFKELLDSIKAQTYAKWELIIADAGESDRVEKLVEKETTDAIRYLRLKENKNISENTNAAIAAAKGDYIALLDHDDFLTQDALYAMVEMINSAGDEKSIIAVYSDEDKCDSEGKRFYEPHWKTDFNKELLLSNNYICHFLMVRASVMKEEKLRRKFDGAQDYDLVLRLAAHDDAVLHVPKVLYHWRCHEGSTAGNTESKRYAYDAGRSALEEYYRTCGMAERVRVTDSKHLGFYQTEYLPDIFTVREDVAALCGRVVSKGVVVGGPILFHPVFGKIKLFDNLSKNSSGYMHRANLRMEVTEGDRRAILVRPDLEGTLEEALESGMILLYDPQFIVEV
jgi:glycosyltransferase involved in cell wall biosynthesis